LAANPIAGLSHTDPDGSRGLVQRLVALLPVAAALPHRPQEERDEQRGDAQRKRVAPEQTEATNDGEADEHRVLRPPQSRIVEGLSFGASFTCLVRRL